jgi:hypothetical protein
VSPDLSHGAAFRFRTTFDEPDQALQSAYRLYCYVGGTWLVKYRATSPEGFDGAQALEQFIRTGPWPGRGSPETTVARAPRGECRLSPGAAAGAMFYGEIPLPLPARQAAFCAWRFELEGQDPPVVQHSIPPDGTTNLVLVRSPDSGPFVSLVGPFAGGGATAGDARLALLRLAPAPEAVAAVLGRLPAPGPARVPRPRRPPRTGVAGPGADAG